MCQRRAVIFDIDGVLVDSYETHLQSWQQLAARHNRQITEVEFAASFGRTSREIITQLWSGLSEEKITKVDNEKEAIYRRLITSHFPMMPGATALIDALAADGFSLAVGSSGPPENIDLSIKNLGRSFSAVVTGRDVIRGKPDPEVFLLAAKRLGIPPAHCAVIEDAAVGLEATSRAGMVAIGLVSQGHTHTELSQADLLVERLQELTPQIIRRLWLSP